MIYEPLHPTYEIRMLSHPLDRRLDRLLQDVCREYNERQAELSRDRDREIIDIKIKYNIAKQKR